MGLHLLSFSGYRIGEDQSKRTPGRPPRSTKKLAPRGCILQHPGDRPRAKLAKLKGGLTVHFLDNDLHFSENHNGWLHPDAGGPMAVVACVAQSQLAVG
jgi:hypothetical protein